MRKKQIRIKSKTLAKPKRKVIINIDVRVGNKGRKRRVLKRNIA